MLKSSIIEWITSYRKLKVVAVAEKSGVFTLLADGPLSAEDIALKSGTRTEPLKVILNSCVALGLLDLEDGAYKNRAQTDEYLVKGKPHYLGNLIQLFSAESPQWEGLDDLLNKGRAPEFTPVSSVSPRQFTLAMHNFGMFGEADALAGAVNLNDAKTMVDVGCGSGVYSIELCKRFPGVHATLIDRAVTLEVTRELVDAGGVSDRITLRTGDITRVSYGEENDAVLLSDVLYQTPDICKGILASAHQALKPGGTLIIRGYFSDPGGDDPVFGALFDVARMLWDPANEPLSIEPLKDWLRDTGFGSIVSSQLTERSRLLMAIK